MPLPGSDHSLWFQKKVQLFPQVLALKKSVSSHTMVGVQKQLSLLPLTGSYREELRV